MALDLTFRCSNASSLVERGCITGVCDASGLSCICPPGYVDDAKYKERAEEIAAPLIRKNCGMPGNTLLVGTIVNIILSFFAFLFTAYQFRIQVKKLRLLCAICALQCIEFASANIAIYCEDGFGAGTWVMIYIWASTMSVMFAYLLLTVSEPIYAMLGKDLQEPRKIIFRIEMCYIVSLLILLVQAYYASDFDKYVIEFSDTIVATCIILIFACLIAPILLLIHSSVLVREIKKLLASPVIVNVHPGGNDLDNTQTSKKPEHGSRSLEVHLLRLRVLQFGSILFLLLAALLYLLQICLFFVYRSIPYAWCFWFVGFTILHYVSAVFPVVYLMRTAKGEKERRKTTSPVPKPPIQAIPTPDPTEPPTESPAVPLVNNNMNISNSISQVHIEI